MKSPDKFIQDLAKKAGDTVLKRFGKDGVHYLKSDHRKDVVTKADLLSNKIVLTAIRYAYPEHGIISEETGHERADAQYVWIIDPIDGTLNFSLGIPCFGVMLCLTRNREVILSVIYLPALKEFYFAKKGKGAYLNGKRIHCSSHGFDQTYGTGSGNLYGRNEKLYRSLLKAGKTTSLHQHSFGAMCVNACYVASGRKDWMWTYSGQLHDFAPPSLILEESGCVVTNTRGEPWSFKDMNMIAGNPAVHKALVKLARNV